MNFLVFRTPSVRHPYAIRTPSVRHPYAIRSIFLVPIFLGLGRGFSGSDVFFGSGFFGSDVFWFQCFLGSDVCFGSDVLVSMFLLSPYEMHVPTIYIYCIYT